MQQYAIATREAKLASSDFEMKQRANPIKALGVGVRNVLLHRRFPVLGRIIYRYQFLHWPIKLRRRHQRRAKEACHRHSWALPIRQHSVLHAFELVVRY